MKMTGKAAAFILAVISIFLSACGNKNTENLKSIESGYLGNEYAIEYSVPADLDISNLNPDINVAATYYNKHIEENIFITNVISVLDLKYLALFYSREKGKATAGYKVAYYDNESERLGEELINVPKEVDGIGKIIDETHHIFIIDYEKLYVYDLDKCLYESVLDWDTYGFSGTEIKAVFGDRGNIVIKRETSDGEEIILLSEFEGTADNTIKEKSNKLIIATTHVSDHLRVAVNEYNKTDPEYQAVIADYSKSAIDNEDAQEKMFLSFLSQDPPDLVNLSEISDKFSYLVNKGCLTDLTQYIESSDEFEIDKFNDKVLKIFRKNEKLYSIPYAYSFSMWCTMDGFTRDLGWSIEDVKDMRSEYPEVALAMDNSKKYILYMCVHGNVGYFMDSDSGKSSFDSDEFKDILKFADTFPDVSDYSKPSGVSYREEMESGKLLSRYMYFDRLENIQGFVGTIRLAGYPSMDGKPVIYIMPSLNSASLAICESSSKKDAAWDFIKYYLERPLYKVNKNDYAVYGIPSNNRILKERIQELSDEEGLFANMVINGVPNHALTEEELALFYSLLEEAEPEPDSLTDILKIVEEDSAAFFAGDKTLDEAVRIIDSRVQLYMDENKQP